MRALRTGERIFEQARKDHACFNELSPREYFTGQVEIGADDFVGLFPVVVFVLVAGMFQLSNFFEDRLVIAGFFGDFRHDSAGLFELAGVEGGVSVGESISDGAEGGLLGLDLFDVGQAFGQAVTP